MNYQLVILKQLAQEAIYADTPRAIANWLGVDVSRETAVSDLANAMAELLNAGHVVKTREPDELNCDQRRRSRGALVDAYWLTESGHQHLEAQLSETSA